jgi:RimJ/RimL family protein N-acetyltransferase
MTIVDTTLAPVHRLVEGRKTRLRPASWGFSEEELRRRYRWSHDDELQYWSGSIPGGRTFERFRDMLAERDWPSDGKRISYAIYTLDDELIGMVSCYSIDWAAHTGELGVYLGEKPYWGHGYGTDAIIAFLRHMFADVGMQMVYLHTYETNERARRSYERVGFQFADRRRRYSTRLGYHDEVRMTITREEFERVHGALQQPHGS